MLLKSSDFITHDLSVDSVFKGTTDAVAQTSSPPYELELVLRKWYPVDSSREFRCFVRKNGLLGRCSIKYNRIFLNSLVLQESRSGIPITTISSMISKRERK